MPNQGVEDYCNFARRYMSVKVAPRVPFFDAELRARIDEARAEEKRAEAEYRRQPSVYPLSNAIQRSLTLPNAN